MAASKMIAALARVPYMDGQDADDCGAYTQSDLHGYDTWVELPPQQLLASWHGKCRNFVCRLIKALSGHPNTGLNWEQHCRHTLVHCGYRPGLEWDFVHKHKANGLFRTVYVDHARMVGKLGFLAAMWAELRTHVDIDHPTNLDGFVYRGVKQHGSSRDMS